MKKSCISKGWKFQNLTKKTPYEDIDLPHDYQIKEKRSPDCTPNNGFFPVHAGRYVKHLKFEKGKHYVLDIDGAYMCAHVNFNENILAIHPHGYTPLLVDLTKYILEGINNKLVITTTPLPDSSRWYSGNGIYRDVFLWEGGDVRIEPWDIFITTDSVCDSCARIRIRYTLSSDIKTDATVKFTVCDGENTVAELVCEQSVEIGKSEILESFIDISDAKLWSIDSPSLYTLKTEISANGEVTDLSENTFGIKTVTADAVNGLLINGESVKLRGGCIHHDHGDLGAAAFPAAEERKVRLLKEAGFNAIRTAHNPPSLALLEACDRLGMVVMDEAFDCWNKNKPIHDYHLFFSDWHARDIEYMVKRDRNHPCVFSYSIGNEIHEIDGTSESAEWCKRLCDEVRRHDDTKFVTSGIQKYFIRLWKDEDIDPDDYRAHVKKRTSIEHLGDINKVTYPYEKNLDIVGTNYYRHGYIFDHEENPDKVMWGSETRVLYFYQSWNLAKKLSYVLGDFTWTAFDNMGEVGAGRWTWFRDNAINDLFLATYPWRNCYQGDYDICGFRRPQSYFREAVWIGNTEPRIFTYHPEHFGEEISGTTWHWYDVEETWTYDDIYVGRPIKVDTYTDADKIVWTVNGKVVGESSPVEGIASIDTVYEKGYIRADAYKNGAMVSSYTLETTEGASAIDLTPEKTEFSADGRDLLYVRVAISDKAGRLVREGQPELECFVQNGELLAFFSGDPKTEDDTTDNKCHAFRGNALAIIRTKKPGKVALTVSSKGLAGATVSVQAK